MTSENVPVAVISDHAIFAGLLERHLQTQANIRLAAYVGEPDDLMQSKLPVEVAVVAAICAESFGLDVLARLSESLPDTRCILISVSEDEHYISSALEYGIYGYLSPLEPVEMVLRAIRLSLDDKMLSTPLLTKAMYFNRKSNTRNIANIRRHQLTERDKRVLQMIWEEKSNKEIAAELFIGIRAVEKIRQNLKRKLGAKSTIGMLKYII